MHSEQAEERHRNDNHRSGGGSAIGATNSNINGAGNDQDNSNSSSEDNDDGGNKNNSKTRAKAATPAGGSQTTTTTTTTSNRPLILITDSAQHSPPPSRDELKETNEQPMDAEEPEAQEEVIDGIRYRIVAAVTAPAAAGQRPNPNKRRPASFRNEPTSSSMSKRLSQVRRKSSAFVSNLLQSAAEHSQQQSQRPRRLSIYEMTKSPPPETSLEVYLSERRRSSTVSAKQIQQQLEQQSTFQTNYNQRQQYFKDLNRKLINQDKKLLNVVANRGQIHRHSVDIAQLPLNSAILQGNKAAAAAAVAISATSAGKKAIDDCRTVALPDGLPVESAPASKPINQEQDVEDRQQQQQQQDGDTELKKRRLSNRHLVAIRENDPFSPHHIDSAPPVAVAANDEQQHRASIGSHRSHRLSSGSAGKSKTVIRKFQKLDSSQLSSTPSPDVKIGQRVAYKEYYGNEFGTIRWIGRVPQISPDWTVGVEFDNAIGEGDGSLHGRRYFISKDCFAKFLPLSAVALVDQHVGRPEPGTMISVMAAASQPGQMISIQRVSTVHVQHCFLNAPHHGRPTGADILAVNTRLHCQCPNCGPCAHVIKPPTTQRLARAGKNATHMCQFSTYTCCGMESQEETMCTYTGNKVMSDHAAPPQQQPQPPFMRPIGHSWMEGSGYLSQLQAQQRKFMPQEYILGAAPEDCDNREHISKQKSRPNSQRLSSRRGSGKQQQNRSHQKSKKNSEDSSGNFIETNQDTAHLKGTTETKDDTTNTNDNNPEEMQNSLMPFGGVPLINEAASEEHYAVACLDKSALSCDENGDDDDDVKSPKVVYRNSIENRYLFPTDNDDGLIDSTLEEDLENLSQARYGYAAAAAASGPVTTRLLGGSSRGLFKSLRSLVSCLNSSSHRSNCPSEFEVKSENTFRYSYGHPQPPFKNRSEPTPGAAVGETSVVYENARAPPPMYSSTTSSAADYRHHYYHHHHHNQRPDSRNQQLVGQQHVSSSSDCGFSSASQNSINNCLSFAAMSHESAAAAATAAATQMLEVDQQQLLRNQQVIYRRIVARMMNNSMVLEEDVEKLKNILHLLTASTGSPFDNNNNGCCLHGSQVALNVAEIDQTIAEIATRSLHLQEPAKQQDSKAANAIKSQRNCVNTTCYCADGGLNSVSDGQESCGDKMMAIGTSQQPVIAGCLAAHKTNGIGLGGAKQIDGGSIASDSITLSSFGSSAGGCQTTASDNLQQQTGKIEARKEDQQTQNSNHLPKAFELKLTLSINSDGKQSLASSVCAAAAAAATEDKDTEQQSSVNCKLDDRRDDTTMLNVEIRPSPDPLKQQQHLQQDSTNLLPVNLTVASN